MSEHICPGGLGHSRQSTTFPATDWCDGCCTFLPVVPGTLSARQQELAAVRSMIEYSDWYKHAAALNWLNALILDLKVQLGGNTPSEPITAERLAAWSEHRRDLEACRVRMELKR